jgi:hypothetical protein
MEVRIISIHCPVGMPWFHVLNHDIHSGAKVRGTQGDVKHIELKLVNISLLIFTLFLPCSILTNILSKRAVCNT